MRLKPIFKLCHLSLCGWMAIYTSMTCHAATPYQHPFYAGVAVGYGSTTWDGLIPSEENKNRAISFSTPSHVDEGGGIWGFTAGYEITPLFALEANYRRFPNASITFDRNSLFAFEHKKRVFFHTHTETVNLAAKLMLAFPNTALRAFSSAGIAGVHRWDEIGNQWQPAPTFGLGMNNTFNERFLVELGAHYTAGHGESEINPAKDFVPFLFSVDLTLAYRFG